MGAERECRALGAEDDAMPALDTGTGVAYTDGTYPIGPTIQLDDAYMSCHFICP